MCDGSGWIINNVTRCPGCIVCDTYDDDIDDDDEWEDFDDDYYDGADDEYGGVNEADLMSDDETD
jgi:hypothetical protein